MVVVTASHCDAFTAVAVGQALAISDATVAQASFTRLNKRNSVKLMMYRGESLGSGECC